MKKITFLVLFFTVTGLITAQKRTTAEHLKFIPYHDIRIGIGYKPFEAAAVLRSISNWGMDPFYVPMDIIDFNVKDYYQGARYTTNALFCEYIYQTNKWFGIGATFTYFSYYSTYFDEQTDVSVGFNSVQHFSFYPTLRFTWLNRKSFSMYSAFGIGHRLVFESDKIRSVEKNSVRNGIAGQITLLGFTVGKNIYGFTDLSTLGTQGLMTIGIGYRFVCLKNNDHEK